MKIFAIALLALASIAAGSPAQEQDYLASRDAFIARFTAEAEAGNFSDEIVAAHEEALDELEMQLVGLIGPVTLDEFSPDGSISLETLFDSDVGFGSLDGVVYGSDGSDARVLVTTDGLVGAWLAGHRDWWDSFVMPDNLADALREESFYVQAISADAAVARFAEIPVTPPAGADFAYAMLDLRRQDMAIGVPDEIIVAVVGGGLLYLATSPVTAPVRAIPACDALWQDYEARAQAADGASDDVYPLYAEGEAAFKNCFAEHAKDQNFYPALVAEAQALADALH